MQINKLEELLFFKTEAGTQNQHVIDLLIRKNNHKNNRVIKK